ncbi:MAG: CRISPR-associated helicase Cas3' [bacterium JZ-2024 1]
MSNIWAKSTEKAGGTPIRLSEHIEDVLKVFNELQGYVRDPHLSELIRLAIVFHDLGKVLPAFQIRTLKNKSYEPSYPYYNVPHSLFSVLWMDRDKLRERIRRHIKDSEKDQEDYLHFVLSAVAYHHWRENFVELLSPHNRELGDLCCELESKGYITRLQENLVEEIKKLNEDWHTLICFNNEMAKGLQNGVPFVEYARPPYQLYWLPKRVDIDESKLRDWILISGFLLRSDHFASFCEEEHEKYSPEHQGVNPAVLKENIKAKIGQTDENGIWQFQAIDQLKDKNVILVAPTGYGKTEFAFLWSNGEKFFYTLPLRAAVNQIYERASKVFKDNAGGKNSENVGLLHSDADVFLMGDGGEAQASMKAYDLARQLAFPAMISTGDQFFPYALRPPGYEKIYATFSYSRLVIDEVQAYDPRAAAIVVKFIEDVVRMGGKFLLMTATLPQFVQDEIDRLIGQSNYGQPKYRLLNMYQEEKDRFKRLKKHHIKVELIENAADESKPDFTVAEDKLKEILNTAKEGKRVLVIANTVKQAQELFSKLKGINQGKYGL